ncbi:MAG: hypothetical protein P1U88_21420 [Thalassobaculaceae bacterium]|nr:hypothetical protein [Thalassobaculaceae bacterium]
MTEITRVPITSSRVMALIDAYGGDPTRWPPQEREAAVALLSGDSELARAADEARLLDLTLDALPMPRPNPALRVTLKDIPERSGGLFDLIAGWFGVGRPAAGLAAAAVLGVLLGATNPNLPLPGFETEATVVADLSTSTADTDTYSLAAASAVGFTTQDTF